MSFSAHFVKVIIKKVFPILRKTQQVNLAYGVFGQIQTQSGFMSEIVRVVPGADKHKHRLKRFWRFLSSHRWKPENLRLFWIRWCLKTFVPDHIVPVAMDWTTLPGDIQCLMIAIPFKGRAIPLLWHIIFHSQIKDSQNAIEERLLTRLVNLVKEAAPEKKLLITADRGFGRAALFQFLLKKSVLFVIRVKGDVLVTTQTGKRMLLSERGKTLKNNESVWYRDISFRSDGNVKGVSLALTVAPPKEKTAASDPWFLVTNLRKAETSIKRYSDRFHIEEWFKDLKHQLGIRQLQTRNLMRVRRLLFVSVVGYGTLMLVGALTKRMRGLQDTLITGGKKAASRIWFAIKAIRHNLLGHVFWKKVYLKATVP